MVGGMVLMELRLLRGEDLSGKVLISHSQGVIQDIKTVLSGILVGSRGDSKRLFEIAEKVLRSLLSLLMMRGMLRGLRDGCRGRVKGGRDR